MELSKHEQEVEINLQVCTWIENPLVNNSDNDNNDIQRRAIRRNFELVGPTLLKDPLGAGWGLLPTLRWMGSWFFHQVKNYFTAGNQTANPSVRIRVPLHCHQVV